MFGALLTLSLMASGGDAAAASSHALDGCVGTRIGEDGWDYGCAEAKARVIDDARQIDPGPYFEGRGGVGRATVGPPALTTRERRRLGGHDAEVLRASWGDVVEVTALVTLPEGTRILDCASKRAEWCGSALEVLAATPWRGGAVRGSIAAEVPPLRIGDHTPKVPAGCRGRPAASGGEIVCPDGFLAGWASMPDDAAASRALDQLGEMLVGKLTLAPLPADLRSGIEPKDLPCRIAGVAATCRSLTVDGGRRRFVAIWGRTALKGVSTIAFCTSDGREAIPSPCSTVFEAR